ncbi:hypothetical protein [Acinetobacter lwoffii]|jgi:hypothetical protein|uniref:Core-2/I-Branching enzyme n=2 Tax=Moraxellaceae TaxID=468 RepID=A0ABP2ZHL0_ACILW|nr:hypothetical protein F995_03082 [Acinetobacter sp. CIP A162]ESJ94575.1 hypothetical protein P800_02668 [Acinetobacter lwoffii NCTC 5866 = CIP 64.10 = NIPH 512]GEA63697.1 hypothetical protein AL1T_09750 [Acinetobacter lwoffii]SUU34138.1 Uncharacterised protein [Acinetobacter lwoffii]VFQ35538.1 Uncharacterised protein [Acinetobacter lwoffii]
MTCLFSIAVHEEYDCVLDMIQNLNYYVPECYIILHIKQDFVFDVKNFSKFSNVFINPEKFMTGYVDGSLLYVHLSNFLLAEKLSLKYQYFSIFGSNQLFVKKGYENYIKQYDCSKAQICTQKDLYGKMNYQYTRFFYDSSFPYIPKNHSFWCAPEGTFYKYNLLLEFIEKSNILDYYNINKKFYLKNNFKYREFLRDLSKLFSKLKLLFLFPKVLLKYTYANEEIFFPNINQLSKNSNFGDNTCYINWENNLNISITDIKNIRENNSHFFSVKRVDRKYNDPIRKYIRETSTY